MILRTESIVTWAFTVLIILVSKSTNTITTVLAANNDNADDSVDDDSINWNYDEVSVLPISCINYNSGHMIKFDFYQSTEGYQCRFNHIGSYVVSISHYMRAYFNQQALLQGNNFALPGDAGYLNCVMLQETEQSETKLYAKIGCMDRETFTSTKLQLHVYNDDQCSTPYDDGETSKKHSTRGYEINGYYFSTRVSFSPTFYRCDACSPEQIAESFNKKSGNWYDDDYISAYGKKQGQDGNNDDDTHDDDYFDDDFNDDAYYHSNDDVAGDDDASNNANANNDDGGGNNDDAGGNNDDAGGNNDDDGNNANNDDDDFKKDDDYYGSGDDYYGRRKQRSLKLLQAVPGQLEAFVDEFWSDVKQIREGRSLYDNNYNDIGNWNMCQRIHKYGVWCGEECRSLDAFRVNQWSHADVLLLVIMCVFMAAMMLLVVAKRLKASEKARLYGDENIKPGLPPFAMAVIFGLIMSIIIVLAKLKFVNETLVFAVVACILLFIYMLKLTLFENRRPVLLAAPRHDVFDNPLDDRLFD